DITCAFEHGSIPATSEILSTAAYRIAQEALTNVSRHAAADHVDVRLGLNNGFLTLAVKDDGRGFDTDALGENEGLGLAGMNERANLAGGHLEIISSPGTGTRVSFKVPLAGAEMI
ncbi:MAG: ATP-binding protein, partial [Desulfobacterales bacterium]